MAAATAISAAPASGARWRSTRTCSTRAGRRVVTNNQISNVWDEFGHGCFTFYISGPWNIAEFKKRLPPQLQDDWMTMPLPGPDGPGASVAGGTSLVVFRRRKHKDAAWKLIAVPVATRRCRRASTRLTGDLPPRRSPWQTPALANDPYARAFRDQLERAKPAPKVPEWERIATEMRLVAEELVHGRLTVDQAAAEMDRRADAHPGEAPLDAGSPQRRHAGGAMKAATAGWVFAAPALAVIARVLRPAGGGRVRAQPDRLRHLRAGRPAQPALRRPGQLHRRCCTTRCSGRRWATRSYFVGGRRAAVDRGVAGRGAAAAFEARRASSRSSAPRSSRRW